MEKYKKDEMHKDFSIYISDRNSINLENLYNKYKELTYGIAFSIVKRKEDAEEIVQEIFLKLHRMDSSQLPRDYEASWLYKVTKNESINFLKKYNKDIINIDEIYNISDSHKDINKVIDIEYFNDILKNLTKQEKEIVSLKIISNMSFREISKLLNIPLGTVEWKYYKSITNLKNIINSLLLFIISLSIGIARNKKMKEEYDNIDIAKDENNSSNNEVENNIIDNDLADEIDIQSNTTNETIEHAYQNEYRMDLVSIGIFSISSILFVITIICIFKGLKNKIKFKR